MPQIDHTILNLKAKKCQSLPKIAIFATITEKNIIQVNLLLFQTVSQVPSCRSPTWQWLMFHEAS